MPTIADSGRLVTGGVDTHAEVHVAGVVDQAGRVLGTRAFPATTAGYRAALAWMRCHGVLVKVGVEGTGSYGAGLARYLAGECVEVAEVIRPNRQARRHQALTAEIAQLDTSLEVLIEHAAPAGFLAKQGVGTRVAATLLAT